MAKTKKRELYESAQHRLIASLLGRGADTAEAFKHIDSDDFENPTYELIYSALLSASKEQENPTVAHVAYELQKTGDLAKVGGVKSLYKLHHEGTRFLQDAPLSIYIRLVAEGSGRSKASRILKERVQLFDDASGISSRDALSELRSDIEDVLLRVSNDSETVTISDAVEDYYDVLAERQRTREENADLRESIQGIPSLLPTLNNLTTGWLPGQMITVGARTGVGKSVFAVNCAMAGYQSGKSVLFFSLEMEASEITDRIVACTSRIPLGKLKNGEELADEDRVNLRDTIDGLKSAKLTIDAEPKQTVDTIRAKALQKAQSDEGLDFIIIDYLQLITPTGRFNSRQEAVADISRSLKLLAKQLKVPVMVLSQLNRKSGNQEGEEEEMPTVDNIRESGAIAQDSDIVILLHRQKSKDGDIPPTFVILAKQRNGASDRVIRCHSELKFSLFREMTSHKEPQEFEDDEPDYPDESFDAEDESFGEDFDELDNIAGDDPSEDFDF